MSGLLQHNSDIENNKNPDKKVEVKANAISRTAAGFGDSKNQGDLIPTFDVNMRIDNHARNAVLALAKTTADKRSASEMVTILVENYLESMNPQSLDVYQELVTMFESKDQLNYKLKRK